MTAYILDRINDFELSNLKSPMSITQ